MSDPAIDKLRLSAVAQNAAYTLKRLHPHVVFTSGRRSRSDQARAMATNVMHNRQWIAQTYLSTVPSRACQNWVDHHPTANLEYTADGLLSVLETFTDNQLISLSRHLSGEAFDVRPVEDKRILGSMRTLPGTGKVLDHEGGLIRWHWQAA
jgi:hypothetical protein